MILQENDLRVRLFFGWGYLNKPEQLSEPICRRKEKKALGQNYQENALIFISFYMKPIS